MLEVEQAAPGNVGAIRSLASELRYASAQAQDARREVQAISGTCHGLPWEGKTADAFRRVVQELPHDVDTLSAGYDRVASVLLGYAACLEGFQQQAGQHRSTGLNAEASLNHLGHQRGELQKALTTAWFAVKSWQAAQRTASWDPSPAAVANQARAARNVAIAQQQVGSLQSQLNAVDGRIRAERATADTARWRLEHIREEARWAARRAAQQIHEAADIPWRNRGLSALGGAFVDTSIELVRRAGTPWTIWNGVKTIGDVGGWLSATLRGAANAVKLGTTFIRQRPRMAISKIRTVMQERGISTRQLNAVGRVVGFAGRLIAHPLTLLQGLHDLQTGGGHGGPRGLATRFFGALGAAGGAVLTVGSFATAASVGGAVGGGFAILGLTVGPPVLIGAAIAVGLYAAWSLGSMAYDNPAPLGQGLKSAAQRFTGGRPIFNSPLMLRALCVF